MSPTGLSKNPDPVFTSHPGKSTLPFCEKLMKAASGFTDTFTFKMFVAFARKSGKRRRAPRKSVLKAIEALMQGLGFHFDPLAGKVNVTLTTLAIECGLATESENRNLAITRATRTLRLCKTLGMITYDTEFCADLGCHFPTDITFCTSFLRAIGISERALEGAARSCAGWQNQKRIKMGLPALDFEALVTEAWGSFRKRFYDYRLKRKQQGEKRARAERDSERTRKEIEKLVGNQLTKEISKGLFPADLDAARREVARRVKERMIMSRGNFSRLQTV
ncbi:incFII family plasmid replication initiator RepA [Pantoea agglomerans]|nr:incFII family plasmid replication initiator RepA [Pantoea agglomerans]TGX88212.1 incFII family plasmid replication initiator RepA [Pantoea agglomerans]